MPACFGSLLPFLKLHGEQAATTLHQVVSPPWARGMTWSKVRSSGDPQYWHSNLSRRNTLNRVKAGWRDGCTYVFRHTTLGRRIVKLGEETEWSYSAMMFTRSRNTALIASCHDQSDKG